MSPAKKYTEPLPGVDHSTIDFDQLEEEFIEDGGIVPPQPPMPKLRLVTPALATLWLNSNDENRSLREAKAEAFARDMKNGAWDPRVGDPLHFNEENGKVGNGQHRMRAVELSGTAQWFYVLFVPKSTIRKIDRGTTRNIKDRLIMEGFGQQAPIVVSVARRLVTLRAGYSPVATGRYTPSDGEVFKVIEEEKTILVRAADVGTKIGKRLPVRPGVAAMAYLVCAQIHPEQADKFFEDQLGNGVGMAYDDPANALVRRLTNYRTHVGQDMQLPAQWNHIIKAWNHFRNGEKVQKLSEPRNGWGAAGYAMPI